MGIRKRLIDRETVIKLYLNQGISKLKLYIETSDDLIIGDEFAEIVSNVVLNDDYLYINKKISELVENELK